MKKFKNSRLSTDSRKLQTLALKVSTSRCLYPVAVSLVILKCHFFFSNISTLLLKNISNIHSEIIIQPDIRSYCFDFKQGKRKWLHVSGWFLELIFSRVWNRFWRKFAVSLLNSVFALWLIEYFDVKSIVLRLFCFVFNISKSF